MAKQPPTIGPLVVTKGRMETGDQFYARALERRGTRRPIDNALAASLDALKGEWPLITRESLKADRAFLLKGRDDNDGTRPLSPEDQAACERLVRWGQAARDQADARVEAEREAARVKAKREAARVEAETTARDLAAARDEVKKAAAIAEAEKAAVLVEAERAAHAEADRIAQVKAWGLQGGRKRTVRTERGVKALKAFWAEQGWDLDKYKPYDKGNKSKIEKTTKKLGVGEREIARYLGVIFPEKTRKRLRRPRSSAAPK
jgi:hypothetical protein